MATATAKIETKTVPTETTEKVVKVELSLNEAAVVHSLLNRVRGDVFTSNRKFTSAVAEALARAGVGSDDCCHFESGNIVAAWTNKR